MITRATILKLLRPRVEDLAVELATILLQRLDVQLDQVFDVARSALLSDLEGALIPAKERNRARSNQLRRESDAAVAAGTPRPRPRRVVSCRSCGAVGFTSKGCGITHSIPGAASSVEVVEGVAEVEAAPVEIEVEVEAVQPDDEESENDPPVVLDDDDNEQEDEGLAPPPPMTPRDRFAAIEARAAARKATERRTA